MYYKWLLENKPVEDCPLSVITFLDSMGLLNQKNIDGENNDYK